MTADLAVFEAIADVVYRHCKSDTADVTPRFSRLTGMERCIDSHKHVTVEHLWRGL